MRVLVACEYSGIVREAFKAKGHDTWSCDLLDTEIPGNHIKGDVLKILNDGWDMMIAHPPCTRICNSGVLRLYRFGKKANGPDKDKWIEMQEAANFFRQLLNADIPKIVVENPIPHNYALGIIGRKYDQVIQPYNFGENASKATCLWLKNVSPLQNTNYYPPRYVNGRPRWANQCDSGQNNLGKNKGLQRAKTYPGIAKAMAEQWG